LVRYVRPRSEWNDWPAGVSGPVELPITVADSVWAVWSWSIWNHRCRRAKHRSHFSSLYQQGLICVLSSRIIITKTVFTSPDLPHHQWSAELSGDVDCSQHLRPTNIWTFGDRSWTMDSLNALCDISVWFVASCTKQISVPIIAVELTR